METIRDRVELLLIDSKLSKTRFAANANVDPSNFAKKIRGEMTFTHKDLEKISTYSGADMNWLENGIGVMGKLDYGVKDDTPKGVPFYNVDFMAGFMEAYNDVSEIDTYISVPGYNNASCWCSVSGNSMAPIINSGDIIALKQLTNWENYISFGEIYGIVTKNDMRTIKIIRRGADDEHYRLVPVNISEYDEQEIRKDVILYMFKVVGAIKRF